MGHQFANVYQKMANVCHCIKIVLLCGEALQNDLLPCVKIFTK
ncbi:hypothetical protein LTSEBAI_5026 [Salmonella enterica subsp. enterica serovar Baildon str. R6-199]|nr:hypothetical protein LTSEBAI_5026 [Salmonella enterica subsp. enterica serovar Baildon str. R6-199]QDX89501.1 hypothetical protein FORC93_3453 [Salmonella enterica subsp. enterica serovar Braenderup]